MLIDRLRAVESDEQFQAQVESAITSENQVLLEERVTLTKQVEVLRSDKGRAERELEQQKQIAAAEAVKAQELIRTKQRESEELAASRHDAESKIKSVSAKLAEMETMKTSVEKRAKEELGARQRAERTVDRYAVVAALCVSALLCVGFEMLVYRLPLDWLKNHTNSFGLQAGICSAILSFMLGLFRPRWRKVWWVTILVTLVVALITLLGGPNSAGTFPKTP